MNQVLSYSKFKDLLAFNPNYSTYSSKNLAGVFKVEESIIKDYRERIKLEKKGLLLDNLIEEVTSNTEYIKPQTTTPFIDNIPSEEELAQTDYRVNNVPHAPPGFQVTSFKTNRGVVQDVWHKKNEEGVLDDNSADKIKASIDNLQNNPKPYKVNPLMPFSENLENGMLLLNITDFHINKGTMDGKTIEQRCEEYLMIVRKTVLRSTKVANIEQIVFVIGSDFLHTDGFTSGTTKGTLQQLNSLPHIAFDKGLEVLTKAIDWLMTIAKVHIISQPGNHSRASEFFLGRTIQAYYRNYSEVTVDADLTFRKSYVYGNSGFMFHHGDNKLEYIVQEFGNFYPEVFIKKHVYCYVGDKHHFHSKEVGRVLITQLGAACTKDLWTTEKGYYSTPKANSFIYTKEEGKIAELEVKI
jgi:hypothetical protein